MKNKLLAILFIGIFVFGVAGCGKKDNLKKPNVKGPRVVCSHKAKEDGIETETTVTLKFNSDKYVNYQAIESTLTFDDKDTFEDYAEAMKDGIELGDDVEYDYSINNKKKQIKSIMIYNESIFDYSKVEEDEKEDYLASTIIEKYEDEKATCKFIETSKNDLGIK